MSGPQDDAGEATTTLAVFIGLFAGPIIPGSPVALFRFESEEPAAAQEPR